MADHTRFRTLIETAEYTAQLDSIVERHSVDAVESVLMGLFWGIATNPERYDKVTWNIYQAKSRSFNPILPMLKVLFGIKNENEVLLLWVEEVTDIDVILEG
jgi:hypothetical protein